MLRDALTNIVSNSLCKDDYPIACSIKFCSDGIETQARLLYSF